MDILSLDETNLLRVLPYQFMPHLPQVLGGNCVRCYEENCDNIYWLIHWLKTAYMVSCVGKTYLIVQLKMVFICAALSCQLPWLS